MMEWDNRAFCCDPMFSHTPYWSAQQLDSFIRFENNQVFTPRYHGCACSKGNVGKEPTEHCPRYSTTFFFFFFTKRSVRSIFLTKHFFQSYMQSIRETLIETKNGPRYFGKKKSVPQLARQYLCHVRVPSWVSGLHISPIYIYNLKQVVLYKIYFRQCNMYLDEPLVFCVILAFNVLALKYLVA